jgi:hypothetical protein
MLGRATLIVTVLLGTTPAAALATPSDVAATHAYIQANYAFTRATEGQVAPGQAKIEAFNRMLAGRCPHVGAGSPEDEAAQPLSYEVAVALWSIAYRFDAGPIRAFVNAVEHLRWSDHRLTRMAQSYASGLHELAGLPMPDLCADVAAWKASGFKTVPAVTTSLDRRVEAIETKSLPASLLARYERPQDKGLEAQIVRLETKLEHTETVVGFSDWDLVLETLGLNQ